MSPTAAQGDDAARTLRGMALEEKVGQLFVADVWGKSADEAHPGNQAKYGVDAPAQVRLSDGLQRAGSLAKVLLGKISPQGKLPTTIPGACSSGAGLTW